ncbi:MAG TPA: tetratricopeptide repeat protein [Pyrinomonadaceae bacterium]|jgi:cytochrome c-type biogenesis protein CcmH/NrfG|nr:tetratricopeptide repeat protein [Pyrinomonadaceae bacterium]
MRRRFITATLTLAAALATAAAANGQSFERESRWGKISALVKDQQGARIAGACVIFHFESLRREAKQNDELVYEAELQPGVYSVTAVAPGFDPAGAPNVHLGPGEHYTVIVTLNVSPPAEVTDAAGGRYFGELFVPCGLEYDPRAAATPQSLLASAQRRKSSTAATKTQAKPPAKSATQAAASRATAPGVVNISTQPGASVWVDEVRRGTTDAEGKLQLKLTPGRHSLRVRAAGFAERTLAILPAQRGALSVVLTKTTDEAELAFQQAEGEREKGNNAQAVESYRRALKLRPRYAAAHLGLARALESQEEMDAALEEIAAARRDRLNYAEASAVEGRILRSLADHEGAFNAYRRALRESKGFQPEAYTGMGIAYEDKGRNEEAAEAFRKAIAQLSDTEPILYELLGRNLERLERWKEAVAAYEKYLELVPTGAHASAINSIIDQLRKQAAETEQQQPPL